MHAPDRNIITSGKCDGIGC